MVSPNFSLKALEIIGFKSFLKRTYLEFSKKITAIIGPNGAGKSNIVNAIDWVMGQKETKIIRSQNLSDLIFSGKENNAGFAQVKLIFNDKENEVEIKRKIKRDGVSEFFLNQKKVRQRDIVEFLATKKIGTKGFSILNQGEADRIFYRSQEERAIMLKEVLGLKPYFLKKEKAKRDLEKCQNNLKEVLIVFNQLLPRLRSLKWHLARAKKKKELEKKLKENQWLYFSQRYLRIFSETPNFKEKEEVLKNELEKLKKEEGNLETLISQKKEFEKDKEIELLEEEKRKFFSKKEKLLFELGKKEAKISFEKEEINWKELVTELKEKIEEILKNFSEFSLEEIKKALNLILEKIKNPQKTKIEENEEENTREIKKEIELLNSKIEEINKKLNLLSEEKDRFQKNYQEFFKKKSLIQEKIYQIQRELDRINFEKEKFQIKRKSFFDDLRESKIEKEIFLEKIKKEKLIPDIDLEKLSRSIIRLKGEIASIGKLPDEVLKEAKEVEEKYQFLKEQIQDLTLAKKDLEKLIKELESKIQKEFYQGVSGINKEFNRFFEVLFGKGKVALKPTKIQKEEFLENQKNEILKTDRNENSEKPSSLTLGIEIEVNLARKNIKNIQLLSGGEKALVSLALLFGIISYSKPPFVILDEVDASLDEKNSQKISEIIKELSKTTQFIIITHNQSVIQIADIWYGILMKDGTSQIISYKLPENTSP